LSCFQNVKSFYSTDKRWIIFWMQK
jgi:hypothetical protein